MKKVLIISYFFPPSNAMGAQRPYKLAKYFPGYGWDPIILTVKRPMKAFNGRIIETDYKDIIRSFKSKIGFDPQKGLHEQLNITTSKNYQYTSWKSRAIKLVKEIINFPDEQRGWYRFAYNAACNFLDNEKVDAIISTSYPVTSHLIAEKLKNRYKIPWIADLRDLWTQNPYVNKYRLIQYLENLLERKTLSSSDMIVTVTERWINTLQLLHKNKKVFCVSNGYDEDDFPQSSSRLTAKFTITYTGILYNGKRDPLLLFEALSQLIRDKRIKRESVEIRFYGPKEFWLSEDIRKYGLEGVVYQHGVISRSEALKRQRESQLLLILLWNNKNEEGFCPGKIYEYFGAGRPIIATGWYGSIVKDMLEATNAGKFAVDVNDLKIILLDYYYEFIENGNVKYKGDSNLQNYTYNSLVQKYSVILNGLISK